jgi:endonuclease/exonuclease/phosphatase family metal-dependent hydrolase
MSYNVHGLSDDRAALAETVRAVAPDVLVVQEAPRRLRWRTRNAQLAHVTGLVYAAGGAPTLGNVVLTSFRVRALSDSAVRFPLTPGRHLRGAVLARCAVPNALPFTVVGSHLATDDDERPGQARLLHDAVAGVDEPVILGVDANEVPDGESFRVLAGDLVDTASSRTAESRTFPATAPQRRIDALLVDKRIEVSHFDVIDTPAARRGSDHLPLLADLVLPS